MFRICSRNTTLDQFRGKASIQVDLRVAVRLFSANDGISCFLLNASTSSTEIIQATTSSAILLLTDFGEQPVQRDGVLPERNLHADTAYYELESATRTCGRARRFLR